MKNLQLRYFCILAFMLLSMESFAGTLKVMTFNAWLLKVPVAGYLSKDNAARRAEMIKQLGNSDADVITMQEVWSKKDKKVLAEGLRDYGYSYSLYTSNGCGGSETKSAFKKAIGKMMGNGLLIVSKLQLNSEKVKRLCFSNNTRADEKMTNKGAIFTQVLVDGKWIDLVTSHFGAISFDAKTDSYKNSDFISFSKQVKQLREWISKVSPQGDLIVTTDLNYNYLEYISGKGYSLPYTHAYLDLTKGMNALDTFGVVNGRTEKPVFTFDAEKNHYVATGHFAHSEVIDYIFLRTNSGITVTDSQVMFDQPIEALQSQISKKGEKLPGFLSDHFGIMTTLELI